MNLVNLDLDSGMSHLCLRDFVLFVVANVVREGEMEECQGS